MDAEYLCMLLVEVLKMPVCFLDQDSNIKVSFNYGASNNPLHKDQGKLLRELFEQTDHLTIPIIKSTPYYENYFAVKLIEEGRFKGTFVVGPSAYSAVTSEMAEALVLNHNFSLGIKRQLIHYYNGIAIFDYTRLMNASILLYYCIYKEQLRLREVMEKNSSLSEVSQKMNDNIKESLSKNRQNIFFHHSLSGERRIFNCIKMGDKEKLLKYSQNPLDGEVGILSKSSPLRGRKNHAICSVTLATRAAMEGGLDSETAYTLSDLYIQEIEELKEIKDLTELDIKMQCDFADRVKKVREYKYSRPVNLCQRYILKYLYEEISLGGIAEWVGVHPNYLSERFRKETGLTIGQYIHRERVEEAKRLMETSSYSLLDIAAWLRFHDQSHFARVFKKYTGMTPSKYRAERS